MGWGWGWGAGVRWGAEAATAEHSQLILAACQHTWTSSTYTIVGNPPRRITWPCTTIERLSSH